MTNAEPWTRMPTIAALISLSVTQLVGWGASFYLPAVTGPAMAGDLNLPLPVIMGGPTVMLVIMAMLSWPLGPIFERLGARPIMTIGSAIGAMGMLIMGFANGLIPYVLAWIVLGFSGACMLTTPAQIALTEVAREKSRQALSVLILAGGLTSTIIWPLTGFFQAQWGWRATTLIFAALLLFICLPLHAATLARSPREKSAKAVTKAISIDKLRFSMLAVSFAANGFVTWGFALTIIILFEAAGLTHASALTAAACIGLAQWAGRLLDVLGGRRLSGFLTGLAGAALFPLSFVVLLLTSNVTGAVIFAMIYGMASGITAVTRATLPLEMFPADVYARAQARLALPLNISYAAAPPAFTAILTFAGPHAALWVAMTASLLAFASLLALWLLQRLLISDARKSNLEMAQ